MDLDIKIINLKLSRELVEKLRSLSLYTIEDLWKCNRIFFKEHGFTDFEINQIQIQLQLHSLDFNKKIYKL